MPSESFSVADYVSPFSGPLTCACLRLLKSCRLSPSLTTSYLKYEINAQADRTFFANDVVLYIKTRARRKEEVYIQKTLSVCFQVFVKT